MTSTDIKIKPKNVYEDSLEMSQSRSEALPAHLKKEGWGTNSDKSNATCEITDTQAKYERQQWNCLRAVSVKNISGIFERNFTLNSDAAPNYKYSRTSLSRTRLFRITAYLEVKIWSLF